ncbi:MAG TPA: hypothetical protein VN920_10010, partial [Pyrinomonadaceae bacterium]|nr:hypothetical protein [Pyrinomonadaceae bacterium]
MSENETAPSTESPEAVPEAATANPAAPVSTEDITYHAVEKDGVVTAIWEMQGRKHLRTIDPRSRQGQDILRLYTTEHQEHHETVIASSDAS